MAAKSRSKELLSRILRIPGLILLTVGIVGFAWYGFTRLSAKKTSVIPANDLQVSDGKTTCRLIIPEGSLTFRYPYRSAVGMESPFQAEVLWDKEISLSDCSGPEQNWRVELDARPAIIGADIKPGPNIRQPLAGRAALRYKWAYISESAISKHPAQFWLRLIIASGDRTLENWDLLVREFQTEAVTFLGLSAPIALAVSLISVSAGALLLLIFRKPKTAKNN